MIFSKKAREDIQNKQEINENFRNANKMSQERLEKTLQKRREYVININDNNYDKAID